MIFYASNKKEISIKMSELYQSCKINVSRKELEDAAEENGDEWTFCWNCAKVIASKIGNTYMYDDFYVSELKDPEEILEWNDGVYQCMVEHKDGNFHEFALDMRGDHLFMVATNEGQEEVIKKIFPRDVWVELYESALEGDLNAYKMCFGLSNESMNDVITTPCSMWYRC